MLWHSSDQLVVNAGNDRRGVPQPQGQGAPSLPIELNQAPIRHPVQPSRCRRPVPPQNGQTTRLSEEVIHGKLIMATVKVIPNQKQVRGIRWEMAALVWGSASQIDALVARRLQRQSIQRSKTGRLQVATQDQSRKRTQIPFPFGAVTFGQIGQIR